MKIVELDILKAHCNALEEDEDLLTHYGEVAEEMVVAETRRTDAELLAMGGGTYPYRIKQAVLLIAGHLYKTREAVSSITQVITPFAYSACIKPFRKFDSNWRDHD